MYYIVLNEAHKKYCACKQEVNWLIPEITGSDNANGYIVQHFIRKATPQQVFLEDIEYFEAWRIENGVNIDRGNICDDIFIVGDWGEYDYPTSDMANSIGTKGCFEFCGEVYWISAEDNLFQVVDKWSEETVKQANGLKASYTFTELENRKPLFQRIPFVHKWDYSVPERFQKEITDFLFHLCPERKERDVLIFEENLADIFSKGVFLDVKQKISSAWYGK